MVRINPRIFGACIIGIALISGALLLSKYSPRAQLADSIVLPAKAPERSYIDVTDKNNNKVPDWQEAFDAFYANAPSPENSLTSEISRALAEDIAQANLDGVAPNTPDKIIERASARLNQEIDRPDYSPLDIKATADVSLASLRKYGNSIAGIGFDNPIPQGTEHELLLLQRAFVEGNVRKIEDMDNIEASYAGMVEDFLALEVPISFQTEHLQLVESMAMMAEHVRAFRTAYEDPLKAILHLKEYSQSANSLYTAISDIYLKLSAAGIQWDEADIASQFIVVTE